MENYIKASNEFRNLIKKAYITHPETFGKNAEQIARKHDCAVSISDFKAVFHNRECTRYRTVKL